MTVDLCKILRLIVAHPIVEVNHEKRYAPGLGVEVDEKFLERLQSYLELAPALRERVPEIDYVDLRFGTRVYVRPAALAKGGRRTARSPASADRTWDPPGERPGAVRTAASGRQ